ncbi:hypothetical protein OH687_38110 [Burkholderia anthina]|nr:hypothetical protein OH687_38110 [Burkholderia anthina]
MCPHGLVRPRQPRARFVHGAAAFSIHRIETIPTVIDD